MDLCSHSSSGNTYFVVVGFKILPTAFLCRLCFCYSIGEEQALARSRVISAQKMPNITGKGNK